MGQIIQTSDFMEGRFKLSTNTYTNDDYELYIEYYEKDYLTKLLGAELYGLFIADLVDGMPQTQRFIEIFNSFSKDVENCLYLSDGMKPMLKGMLVFEIARKDITHTLAGNSKNVADNGQIIPSAKTYLVQNFNNAVSTFKIIQWHILENKTTYPEFNGVEVNSVSWL